MHRRLFLETLAAPAFAQYEESKGDVPWVPTPDEVIDTLFHMAKLKPNELVYDIGSGDGRVLIYAAKKFKARGVGIEIEGHRVKEAEEAAEKAGVSSRVRFVEQDALKAQFADAAVIYIYMFTAFMTRLMPRILAECKPGTRVIAYQFNGFKGWKPAKVNQSHDYPAYLWIVPTRRA